LGPRRPEKRPEKATGGGDETIAREGTDSENSKSSGSDLLVSGGGEQKAVFSKGRTFNYGKLDAWIAKGCDRGGNQIRSVQGRGEKTSPEWHAAVTKGPRGLPSGKGGGISNNRWSRGARVIPETREAVPWPEGKQLGVDQGVFCGKRHTLTWGDGNLMKKKERKDEKRRPGGRKGGV